MNRFLVVNADDAGASTSCDDAILGAARTGVLTSASVLAHGANTEAFVAAARQLDLGLGLHFNLTEGRPLGGPYRTLTGSDGDFLSPKARFWDAAARGRLDQDEIGAEARAQWEHVTGLGARLAHVDGHNHIHVFDAVLDGLARGLADARRGLWVRVPHEPECPAALRPALPREALSAAAMSERVAAFGGRLADRFVGFRFTHEPSLAGIRHLEPAVPGVTEWMTHPGCRLGSRFTTSPLRLTELACLQSTELRTFLADSGYRLATFEEAS